MPVRTRHRVEYAALRVLDRMLRALPLSAAYALMAVLASIVYRLFPGRPREARRRIAQVFPEKSSREIDAIARASLRNLFFNIIELVKFPGLSDRWCDQQIDYASFLQNVHPHLAEGQGAIFVIPHMGNWDLAGLVGARRFHLPMFFIVGRQRNPLTDAWIQRIRGATGLEFLYREDNNVRAILKKLKEGKIFGMLPDVRMRTPGIPVSLFGFPADIPGGAAVFARRARVPIILGFVRRVGWTRHAWHFEPPFYTDEAADPEEEARRIAQRIADTFTAAVRAYPDQYFWYNKRWVLEPRNPQEPSTEGLRYEAPKSPTTSRAASLEPSGNDSRC